MALFLAKDPHHLVAARLWAQGGANAIVTSHHVVGETWTVLRRRNHGEARRALEALNASRRVSIVGVSQAEEIEAWDWLYRHDEREYSLVDATSFSFMRRRRIREALVFDGDFAAAGFNELRP